MLAKNYAGSGGKSDPVGLDYHLYTPPDDQTFAVESSIDTPKTYDQKLECAPSHCSAPCKPNNVRVTEQDGYLLVQWDEPVSNGGCDIFNYNIYYYYCPEDGCHEPNNNLELAPACTSPGSVS